MSWAVAMGAAAGAATMTALYVMRRCDRALLRHRSRGNTPEPTSGFCGNTPEPTSGSCGNTPEKEEPRTVEEPSVMERLEATQKRNRLLEAENRVLHEQLERVGDGR